MPNPPSAEWKTLRKGWLNKQNVYDINLFLKFNLFSLKIIVDIDWRQMKHFNALKNIAFYMMRNTQPYFLTQMFQSFSEHSSEQSIANYSSRPTVAQFKGGSDSISNTNHRGHRFPPSLTFLSIHPKLELSGFQCWPKPKVFRTYFQIHERFNATYVQFSLLTGLLWWQRADVTFPAFSIRVVDLAAQF